jgi:hypothetical protein
MTSNIAKIPNESKELTAVTPMDMIRTALEKGIDPSKLLDLQERWEATEAKKAFVAAMGAFKSNPPELIKNKAVSFGKTGYSHATLDHISDVIGKALTEHGITHRWAVDQDNQTIGVTCILTHELGHSESTSMSAPSDTSGSKNSIQAIGSTVTYLERYTLLAATGLATKDMDNDAGGPVEFINANQRQTIERILDETDTNFEVFLNGMFNGAVKQLQEIPAHEFPRCMEMLNKKKRLANAGS